MSSQIRKYCFLLIVLLISSLSFAQKQFHITIQFVPKLDTNNITVMFDDGKGFRQFPFSVKNGKMEINASVYSKYATVNLYYPDTKSAKLYFITNEKSSIVYSLNNKSNKDYPFVNSKLVNAIELTNCIEMKNWLVYTQKEREDLSVFEEKHFGDLNKNDSLMSIYKQKNKLKGKKGLEFIKLNCNQYFYLWLFNLSYKNTDYISADSLLQYYKDVLYPKYKDLFEAKFILDFLQARALKVNQQAPDFTTTDIAGKKVSLRGLKGKYVYINVWATWCGPCVEELPLLKKLRDEFPEDQLEMISISEDKTKTDLENGIKNYGLNWTNVFKDKIFLNKYDISGAVPLSFLIDKEGKLVFMQVGASIDIYDKISKLISGIKN